MVDRLPYSIITSRQQFFLVLAADESDFGSVAFDAHLSSLIALASAINLLFIVLLHKWTLTVANAQKITILLTSFVFKVYNTWPTEHLIAKRTRTSRYTNTPLETINRLINFLLVHLITSNCVDNISLWVVRSSDEEKKSTPIRE